VHCSPQARSPPTCWARLCFYVHHTDAVLDEAKAKGWTVVSMKDDWKKIFPFDP